ncbi:hypothetical protein HDC92_001813 [Pedobacter sp. AK017]|uniref:TlpA family protein disulfide reductase n=1 Tax=Pedobacter sp. AK017 TaxID=2723073 RepID=UPI0016118DF9|nr:thioredoxin-like domain-containing protein [Pedobacter sp. AK017]MBB5438138.1 hypothetical protein [Pedobacter sp. AK017]
MRILNMVFMLTCICTNIEAQTNINLPSFSGKVYQNDPAKIDTIAISYKTPYASAADGISHVEVITDSSGNFAFKLPRYSQPAIIAIRPRVNGKVGFLYSSFFFEPTDNIFINIYKNTEGKMDSASFSGIGSAKYNLIRQLSSPYPARLRKKEIVTMPPANLATYLSELYQHVDELKQYKEDLLKETGLDTQMEKMIRYDFANAYNNWLVALGYWYTVSYKDKFAERELIKRHFNTFKEEFQYPEDPAMALVPSFLEKIAFRENLDLVMNAPGDTIPLKRLYDVFKTKYTGLVREELLANFFLAGKGRTAEVKFDDQLYDSLFKDARKLITLPILKKPMDQQAKTLKGRKFFNTSYTDINGKQFDSSTLKGKVIFIDLWGTGCTWCAIFHQGFHKDYYPLLKDNSDFVYLSIGTNKETKRWKEGIASGKYTSTEYLNVYTSGQTLQHPFTKYYNIKGVPFLLLIGRDGNIVSGNIVEPKGAFQLIQRALKMPKQGK